jgi:hypothetical protein
VSAYCARVSISKRVIEMSSREIKLSSNISFNSVDNQVNSIFPSKEIDNIKNSVKQNFNLKIDSQLNINKNFYLDFLLFTEKNNTITFKENDKKFNTSVDNRKLDEMDKEGHIIPLKPLPDAKLKSLPDFTTDSTGKINCSPSKFIKKIMDTGNSLTVGESHDEKEARQAISAYYTEYKQNSGSPPALMLEAINNYDQLYIDNYANSKTPEQRKDAKGKLIEFIKKNRGFDPEGYANLISTAIDAGANVYGIDNRNSKYKNNVGKSFPFRNNAMVQNINNNMIKQYKNKQFIALIGSAHLSRGGDNHQYGLYKGGINYIMQTPAIAFDSTKYIESGIYKQKNGELSGGHIYQGGADFVILKQK